MRKIAFLMIVALLMSSSAYAAGLHGQSLKIARGVKAVEPALSKVCPNIVPWPSRLLYKSETSGHLSRDVKSGGTTIVAGLGCRANPINGLVRMYNIKGKLVSTAKIYRGNNGIVYRWRAYSRGTGGSGETPSTIVRRLRSQTKSLKSYLQFKIGNKVSCSLLRSPIGRQGSVR